VKSRSSKSRTSISPARAAAFDILLRVEHESAYASELLHSQAYKQLMAADHALAMELVMGVLRWRSILDSEIAKSSAQPISKLDSEILTALRLAVYQLGRLRRIPARAAINESVELVKRARKRSAAPFVNAVLRKIAGSLPAGDKHPSALDRSSVASLATSSAHPLWLVERWINTYGFEAAIQICQYNQSVPVTAIRLRRPEAEDQLRAEGIELAPGAFLATARRVQQGDISKTAAYRASLCAIQDEASQLVAALVGRVGSFLDCCAAPGGKTAAIADQNPNARIVAADLHPHRAALLKKLLRVNRTGQSGQCDICVIAADTRALPFVTKFDCILADVPCSGTGTLSRNPEIKWRLTSNDLADLQTRQLSILQSALAQVATGGRLIYSTCSLEREENEDVIVQALKDNSAFHVVDCGCKLKRLQCEGVIICSDVSDLTSGPYLRTLPGVHQCDGFFAAILERV
jgi:16S rRNA (cytosine967-C5)-methyltransferase